MNFSRAYLQSHLRVLEASARPRPRRGEQPRYSAWMTPDNWRCSPLTRLYSMSVKAASSSMSGSAIPPPGTTCAAALMTERDQGSSF